MDYRNWDYRTHDPHGMLKHAVIAGLGATTDVYARFATQLAGVEWRGGFRHSKSGLEGLDLVTPLTGALAAKPIVVRRETSFDRFAKAIRVNREFTSGDEVFDRTCYVDAELTDEALAPVFGSPAVRAALVRLIAGGVVDTVTLDDKQQLVLGILKKRLEPAAALRAALLEAAPLVAALAELFTERAQRDRVGYRDETVVNTAPAALASRSTAGLVLGLVYVASYIAGIFVLGEAPATLEWSWLQIGILGGVFSLHLALLVVLFGGRSHSLQNVLLALVFGTWMLSYLSLGLLQRANAWFDTSSSREADGRIIQTSGKDSHYEAQVLGLSGKLSGKGRVGSVRLDEAVTGGSGQPAHFVLRQGALGACWIQSFTLLPATTPGRTSANGAREHP